MDAYFVMKPFEYISSLSAPNFRSNDKQTKMPKKINVYINNSGPLLKEHSSCCLRFHRI